MDFELMGPWQSSSPAQYLTRLSPSEGFPVPRGQENVAYHWEFKFINWMEAVITK